MVDTVDTLELMLKFGFVLLGICLASILTCGVGLLTVRYQRTQRVLVAIHSAEVVLFCAVCVCGIAVLIWRLV